jgi:hypothetical protein
MWQVNGTVVISEGSTAEVVVDGTQESDTKRVTLVQAKEIIGSFASIGVKGEGRKAAHCYSYFAASTDQSDGTLSVLVVAKEKPCSTKVFRIPVIGLTYTTRVQIPSGSLADWCWVWVGGC